MVAIFLCDNKQPRCKYKTLTTEVPYLKIFKVESFLLNGMFTGSFEDVQIFSFTSNLPLINSSGISLTGDGLQVNNIMD